MRNPWEGTTLTDYENHMKLDSVRQLQAMNQMMKEQFYTYPAKSAIILGIAGGNGLEHIDKRIFRKVYGVDINQKYLECCIGRYPGLKGIFESVTADLTNVNLQLPHADLLVANLLVEYIGYKNFQRAVKLVKPHYVSCIIQINEAAPFVSDSPYSHVFDHLDEIYQEIDAEGLENAMTQIGYKKGPCKGRALPNGKKFARIDFTSQTEK